MSTNIDATEVKILDAWIHVSEVDGLSSMACAEGCFFDELRIEGDRAYLTNFWWYGEASGSTYRNVLIKKIAPHIMGHVEVVFTWEGGNPLTGLIICDGVVTECDVVTRLVPREK